MSQIKIAMADDEELFLNGLKSILERDGEFDIIITAQDGSELIQKYSESNPKPDIILLDMRMKGMDGLSTTSAIHEIDPDARIIMLSSHYRDAFLGYMLKMGVNAFLPKNISPDRLIKVIEKVYQERLYFDPSQMMSIQKELSEGRKPKEPLKSVSEELTKREKDVLRLICEQFSNAEIAEKLFVSIRTVEGHRNNLFQKTGAKNSIGLVLYALYYNIIDREEHLLKFGLSQ